MSKEIFPEEQQQEIDQYNNNNKKEERKKKVDASRMLQQRLYDQGFQLSTMPSVKRPDAVLQSENAMRAKLVSYKSRINKLEPIAYQKQSIVFHQTKSMGGQNLSPAIREQQEEEYEEFEQQQQHRQAVSKNSNKRELAPLESSGSRKANKPQQQTQSQFYNRQQGATTSDFFQPQQKRGLTSSREKVPHQLPPLEQSPQQLQQQQPDAEFEGQPEPQDRGFDQELAQLIDNDFDFHKNMYKTQSLFCLPPSRQTPQQKFEPQSRGFPKTEFGLTGTDFFDALRSPPLVFKDTEMFRTKYLIDKQSGKFNIPKRYVGKQSQTGQNWKPAQRAMLKKMELDKKQLALEFGEAALNSPDGEGQGSSTMASAKGGSQQQQQQQTIQQPAEELFKRPTSKLDNFIDLILKNVTNIEEFIYLIRNNPDDPYDLTVVEYETMQQEQANNRLLEYYTVSKRGLCHYMNGKPVDYIQLASWLKERETYDQIKNLQFFRRFRKWKTLKMWKTNIIKSKTISVQKKLEDKLFILNPILRKTLLDFRRNTQDMQENLRFIGFESAQYTMGDTTYTLEKFKEKQEAQRKKIYEEIKKYSESCRTVVKEGFEDSLNVLKRNQYMVNPEEETGGGGGAKKQGAGGAGGQNFFRLKESAYENLGFSDNMSYEKRSELRKECSKFLRFSYLADFLALESLSNIFIYSVRELENKIRGLVEQSEDQMQVVRDLQSKGAGEQQEPLFHIMLELNFKPIEEKDIQVVQLKDFVPPPIGTSTEKDFNMLYHVRLMKMKETSENQTKEGAEPEEDAPAEAINVFEEKMYDKRIVPNLAEIWLKLSPDNKTFFNDLMRCVAEGLNSIQAFERWSRHDDMTRYVSVLEEWDDMVGDDWEHPEQTTLNPSSWLESSPTDMFSKTFENLVDQAFAQATEFTKREYQECLMVHWEYQQLNMELFTNERLDNPTETLNYSMKVLQQQQEKFDTTLPYYANLGLLKVDTAAIRKTLERTPKDIVKKMQDLMPDLLRKRNVEVKAWMDESLNNLKSNAPNIDDFVKKMASLRAVQKVIEKYKNKLFILELMYQILEDNKFEIKKEDKQALIDTRNASKRLEAMILSAEEQSERSQERYIHDVQQNLIPKLKKDVGELYELVRQSDKLTEEDAKCNGGTQIQDQAIPMLEELTKKCKELDTNYKTYNQYELTLGLEVTRLEDQEELKVDLELRYKMWVSRRDWKVLRAGWIDGKFIDINTEEIIKNAEAYTKQVQKCQKRIQQNPVLTELSTMVSEFKNTMPIVLALRNKHLKDYHWDDIKRVIGRDFQINEEFTLKNLLDMDVASHLEEIQEISTQATQEAVLAGQLQEVKKKWEDLRFVAKQYQKGGDGGGARKVEVYVLDEMDDLYAAMDDLLASMNNILGSRYLKRLRDDAEALQKKIMYASETIDDWAQVQRNWIYLENIFSSGDIKNTLKDESQKFEKVDQYFKKQMTNTYKFQLVSKCVTEGMKKLWSRYLQDLNDIQKALDIFLEGKRSLFPRFYFLSNDELLEILGKSNDMEVVQKNMKKCFDGIHRLMQLENSPKTIMGMISPEGEQVAFNKSVNARGKELENWLQEVQTNMIECLQKYTKKCKDQYELTDDRSKWALEHLAQVVATVDNLIWTNLTEYYIQQQSENENALSEWVQTNYTQLEQLTKMVASGTLKSLEHKSVVALITQDVHARDILDQLLADGVQLVSDFIWNKQLRYYWEAGGQGIDIVTVKQVNAHIKYGYEYMGATTRLVITPLTDRCWITITGAINIQLGAAPAGPAGTGKTESTKDLGKALGMLCVVFNCSDQIEYKMMGRLFSGLSEQGAWSCLDEFNRIDIEVLSVIAQQLLTIRQALLRKIPPTEKFLFMDRLICLKSDGYGVFITMNPGYAGRTELPDNLKVLFRPVAMMIPDYAMIAEIMLFSEGFEKASTLSKKMKQLYKLSSEQLSQQDHYDFGMRAVKSVLVMAGSLKRAQPDLSEDVVLIRAMRDSNIPKFLKDDLPLFNALVQDLFPGIVIPEVNYGELAEQIAKSCTSLRLQHVPELALKVIQLFDTFNVRFGVMLVGLTCSGKTACYKILQDAMTELKRKYTTASPETYTPQQRAAAAKLYQEVYTKVLNPKCISMGELYGEVNAFTQEWQDGLASQIMREAAADETENRQWVVFDGPVDALWIENMNTVLDDNMMLCLANGQRIKLRAQMRMLFEVQDLRVASPATVSRCGMVYLVQEDIGWRPRVHSWVDAVFGPQLDSDGNIVKEEYLSRDLRQFLFDLFDKNADSMLSIIRSKMSEPILTSDMQLVQSICNLVECFLCDAFNYPKSSSGGAGGAGGAGGQAGGQGQQSSQGGSGGEQRVDASKRFINHIFAFAFIWGMCATVHEKHFDKLNDLIRDRFPSIIFPNQETVYSYYLDTPPQGQGELMFKHWNDRTPTFEYDKETPYFNILVPTVDTVRYSYFVENLLSKKKHVYVTGGSGTGKSVVLAALLVSVKERCSIDHFQLIFSAQTSSLVTQLAIEGKLEKIKKTLLGAKPNRKTTVFIDDVNMPAVEEYGAQPPIELLRLLVDKGGLYDRRERFWKDIQDTILCCCSAPPGGGRSALTQRFTRHFNILNLPQPTQQILQKIFESMLSGFFVAYTFPEAVKQSVFGMVGGTIETYQRISQEKLPIPSKFHYTFNLRDVSKVFQGIMMVLPSVVRDESAAARLWIHEVSRVFHDRLINTDDRQWFYDLIMELMSRHFKVKFQKEEIFGDRKIMFSDILRLDVGNKEYEEIKDLKKLEKTLLDKLDDYNGDNPTKMNLVFFNECIEHVLRISRILRSPRGSAMLIGVGGSGKQSLTRLASYMLNSKTVNIEVVKGYNRDSFREFIKLIMRASGIDGKQQTFLFTDTQIIYESFLEDINNILNSGEVPNLWQPEEKDAVISDTRPINAALKRTEEPDTIYKTFVERVRNFLHIVLCMSPIGDSLRVRCRKFPSLVDCCSLDWFAAWPKEALISVAQQMLKDDQAAFPMPQNVEAKKDYILLTRDEIIAQLADMCKEVHISATAQADKFEAALKRKVYNTPKSYLDLIKLYISTLKVKREELITNQTRLANGLTKLEQANKQVAELQVVLTDLKPQLERQTVEVEQKKKIVEAESKEAEEKEIVVSEEAAVVQKQKDKIQLITDEAQAELDKVMPELIKSQEALEHIDENQLKTLKTMSNPPAVVGMVFEAVCVLMGTAKTDWPTAQKLIMDVPQFVYNLKNFDKENIPADKIRKLKKCLVNPDFVVSKIQQKVSYAADIAQFCIAIDIFSDVNQKVRPKKEQAAKLNAELAEADANLNKKLSELQKVKDRVQRLRDENEKKEQELRELQQNKLLTEQRLERAKKLITLTADEAQRWKKTVQTLKGDIENLFGDVFLASAAISYNGPFTGIYRAELVKAWIEGVKERNIPNSEEYSILSTLGDPLQLREWVINGLPSDVVSQESSIFVSKGFRWPLLIDPQLQANKWIRNIEKHNKLEILKFKNPKFIQILQGSIPNGYPILFEDVDDQLDPAIDTILAKAFYESEGRTLIRFADKDMDYHKDFRLYMCTKKPNPQYLPEIFIKVTVINFTATFEGLEDQLLADVVLNEKPDIEEQRDENVRKMADYTKQIQQSEKLILRLLADAKAETILDDVNLIHTLEQSKEMAIEIEKNMKKSKDLEKTIEEVRNSYRQVSIRGSILFFVIKDLSLIDPMYQYSLQYIQRLFRLAIKNGAASNDLPTRLKNLIDSITQTIYTNVCRGLFEAHKLLFSFLICSSINKKAGILPESMWSVLLRGCGVYDKSKIPPNPDKTVITQSSWDLAYFLDITFPEKFGGLCKSVASAKSLKPWQDYIACREPLETKFPDEWDSKLDPFEKMLLLKVFRPEKILFAVSRYVLNYMGQFYLEAPQVTMEKLYADSDIKTPIIFVLSQGADPTSQLLSFAKARNMEERLKPISLGQGQGEKAKKLIEEGKLQGYWIFLQNCHLARTFMPELEVIIENIPECFNVHEEFRIYLTSMPASYFPVSVLQNGIKLTTEPPRGLKANLKRSWGNIEDAYLNGSTKREPFHKLVWGLTYFHAIIQERRKFGPLGWNIRYEFNDSDLDTSTQVMKMLIEEQEQIPWKSLIYITGHINYGGRVTDDLDRRCLITILSMFYTKDILEQTYKFSESDTYIIPPIGEVQSYRDLVEKLPLNDDPAVFGMHENANITYQQQESDKMMQTILSIQPRLSSSGGGKSSDETVKDLVQTILDELPEILKQEEGNKELFEKDEHGLIPSLSTVLQQEMQRFNTLLNRIRSTLKNLQQAIDGLMVMSQDLDSTYYSLLNNQVPNLWVKVAYPSLKPLASWIQDLKERVQVMGNWLMNGNPSCYWISGFFFPQGFMTGVLQTHARKYKIAIDELNFMFRILEIDKDQCTSKPLDGVYIYGLFLEGAQWDRKKKTIVDSAPVPPNVKLIQLITLIKKGQMYYSMPAIHFIPTEKYEQKPEINYQCPVYKTSVRAGVLSTTGQSTNFVLPVDLPSTDQPSDYWILRGAALLCQLNE